MEKSLLGQKLERNSSIEMLRIFAGMAVVVLHFNFGVVGAVEITTGITQKILLLLEALCNCAVNVFLLISGYCSANSRKVNLSRLSKLIVQTSVFGLLFRLVDSAVNDTWSLKILSSLLPVNYYVILYVTLMMVAPYINIIMGRLHPKSIKMFLFISMMLFSVYPTVVDVLEECTGKQFMGLNSVSINGSIFGYSIINFILIYIIGAGIRKLELTNSFKSNTLFVVWIFVVIGIYIWHLILPKTGYSYCNPLVILEAVALFLLIVKMEFKSRIVNMIAPAAFTCYLIHMSVLKIVGGQIVDCTSSYELIVKLVIMVIGIYMISFILMKCWELSTKHVYKKSLDKIPVIDVREV